MNENLANWSCEHLNVKVVSKARCSQLGQSESNKVLKREYTLLKFCLRDSKLSQKLVFSQPLTPTPPPFTGINGSGPLGDAG